MKNLKLRTTSRPVKKQQASVKYVEDLLQEDDIDVCAVLNAKFKNPIKTWFASNLFRIEIAFKERKQKVKFFYKKLLKKNR